MIKNTLGLCPGLFKIHYVLMTCMSVVMFAALIPFILKVLGVKFLPSPEPLLLLPTWSHWVIGAVLTLPFSILFIGMAVVSFSNLKIKAGFMLLFSAITFSCVIGGCSNLLLGATIPMLHTAIFGSEGHIAYKMRASYDSHYGVNCKGIAVDTKVFYHSILCGMRLEANHGLPLGRTGLPKKGATIIVYGRTSRAGIFYSSFETAPI